MSQKIRIKLKSYDFNLVDKSAEKIVKTVKTTGAIVTGPIPLPTKKKIFTVLKSPHVNKKSREQFMYKCYSQNLNCSINNLILFKKDQDESFHLLNCLNQNAPEGVSTCLKYVL